MIEAHELTKRYGEKTAVDRISFTIAPGSVTGFLGPNGAGKFTTMRMIVGLDHSPRSASLEQAYMQLTRDAVEYYSEVIPHTSQEAEIR